MSTAPTPSLPHKPHVKLGSWPHLYHIESDDKAGVFYTTDAYRLLCSCEAGRHHRRCWHLALAIQYDAWRKAQRSTPAIPTTAPVAPAPLLARPAGMAALQECFG